MRRLLILVTLLFALPAFALDLDSARKQGLVGEQPDGYVGAVQNTAEVSALVKEVNAKRRAAYEAVAKQNGQSLSVVEKLSAEKLYQKVGPGEYFLDASGKWRKN